MKAAAAFRSGWCGIHAQPWSHARCLGGHDGRPCVCDCHSAPLARLIDAVDQAALHQLVEVIDQVLAMPGVVPPCARKLRAAAVELLEELAPVPGGDAA